MGNASFPSVGVDDNGSMFHESDSATIPLNVDLMNPRVAQLICRQISAQSIKPLNVVDLEAILRHSTKQSLQQLICCTEDLLYPPQRQLRSTLMLSLIDNIYGVTTSIIPNHGQFGACKYFTWHQIHFPICRHCDYSQLGIFRYISSTCINTYISTNLTAIMHEALMSLLSFSAIESIHNSYYWNMNLQVLNDVHKIVVKNEELFKDLNLLEMALLYYWYCQLLTVHLNNRYSSLRPSDSKVVFQSKQFHDLLNELVYLQRDIRDAVTCQVPFDQLDQLTEELLQMGCTLHEYRKFSEERKIYTTKLVAHLNHSHGLMPDSMRCLRYIWIEIQCDLSIVPGNGVHRHSLLVCDEIQMELTLSQLNMGDRFCHIFNDADRNHVFQFDTIESHEYLRLSDQLRKFYAIPTWLCTLTTQKRSSMPRLFPFTHRISISPVNLAFREKLDSWLECLTDSQIYIFLTEKGLFCSSLVYDYASYASYTEKLVAFIQIDHHSTDLLSIIKSISLQMMHNCDSCREMALANISLLNEKGISDNISQVIEMILIEPLRLLSGKHRFIIVHNLHSVDNWRCFERSRLIYFVCQLMNSLPSNVKLLVTSRECPSLLPVLLSPRSPQPFDSKRFFQAAHSEPKTPCCTVRVILPWKKNTIDVIQKAAYNHDDMIMIDTGDAFDYVPDNLETMLENLFGQLELSNLPTHYRYYLMQLLSLLVTMIQPLPVETAFFLLNCRAIDQINDDVAVLSREDFDRLTSLIFGLFPALNDDNENSNCKLFYVFHHSVLNFLTRDSILQHFNYIAEGHKLYSCGILDGNTRCVHTKQYIHQNGIKHLIEGMMFVEAVKLIISIDWIHSNIQYKADGILGLFHDMILLENHPSIPSLPLELSKAFKRMILCTRRSLLSLMKLSKSEQIKMLTVYHSMNVDADDTFGREFHCWVANNLGIKKIVSASVTSVNLSLRHTFIGHTTRVTCIGRLGDGRIISASNDRTLKIWDHQTSRCILTLTGHNSNITSMCVLHDDRIVTCSSDNCIRIWNGTTGQLISILTHNSNGAHALCCILDEWLIVGCKDGSICIWSLSSSACMQVLKSHFGRINCVCVVNAVTFISGSSDNTIKVWSSSAKSDLTTTSANPLTQKKPLLIHTESTTFDCGVTLVGHADMVTCINTLGGNKIVSGSRDKKIKIWDIFTGECLQTISGNIDWINSICVISSDIIVSGTRVDGLRVWRTSTATELNVDTGKTLRVTSLFLSLNDGLFFGCDDGAIMVLDKAFYESCEFETAEQINKFEGHSSVVTCACKLNEVRLATCSYDKSIKIWDIQSARLVTTLEGHTKTVTCIQSMKDESITLVSGSFDETMKIWNVQSCQCVRSIFIGSSVLSLSPLSSSDIAIGTCSTDIKIWSISLCASVVVLVGHTQDVTSLCKYDNTKIISGSKDCSIKLWNVHANHCVKTLIGHSRPITSLSVLSDGRIVSASQDKAIKVWSIISDDYINIEYAVSHFSTDIECDFNHMKSALEMSQRICDCYNIESFVFIDSFHVYIIGKYGEFIILELGIRNPKSSIMGCGALCKIYQKCLRCLQLKSIGTHHESKLWINLDVCGVICASITYMLLLYGDYVFTKILIHDWLEDSYAAWFHVLAFNMCIVLAFLSHLQAMFTNPGAVPKDAFPLPNDIEENDFEALGGPSIGNNPPFRKYCKKCKAFKPVRAHHCSICQRCIIKMDHHCPWVNNCVGIGNHKFFLLFVFWTWVVSCYALTMVVFRFALCINGFNTDRTCTHSFTHESYVVTLFIEAVLFGMFTLCILYDQSTIWSTGATKVERMKALAAINENTLEQQQRIHLPTDVAVDDIPDREWSEICGYHPHHGHSWNIHWVLPTRIRHHCTMMESIYGYQADKDDEDNFVSSSPSSSNSLLEIMVSTEFNQIKKL